MTSGRRLGIVTGLPAEARAARGGGNIRVLCSEASPARAGAHARTLAAWGAEGLASFGVAGGLDPRLPAGAVVVATWIVAPGGAALPVDAEWADRFAAALPPGFPVVRAPVAGTDRPVADARAKAALAESTGAAALDMESHAVARAAAGLPVVAIRAIADPAGRDLPDSALAMLHGRGRAGAGLLRRLRDAPALAMLALDYRRALDALRRAVASSGPDLRFFS